MDKTIETAFFKSFGFGGVLSDCFDWMRQKYDLGFKLNMEHENKPPKTLPEKWQKFYDEVLPQRIKEATEAFDNGAIEYIDSPLMDEIANNLDECKNDMQRDRYIFSLLKPFKEYSDKFNPISEIRQLKGEVRDIEGIKDFERDLAMWESMQPDEALYNVSGEQSGTPKEQAAACKKFIEEYKYRIERANYVADKFRELLGSSKSERWLQDGTVENCMSTLIHYVFKFGKRLDALLLERGINLLWYQNECGIYLFTHRDITAIWDYIGSYELARKYIDEALPKYPQPQSENDIKTTDSKDLPSEPDKVEAPKRGRGRQTKPFSSYLVGDNSSHLETLHSVMNGKTGKEAALIMKVAIKVGWISKPTFTAVKSEFGDIGNRSNFNKYIGSNCFTDDEIKGAEAQLGV